MATKKETQNIEHGTNHNLKEIAEFTARQQRIEQYKAAAKDALQLLDLQNTQQKTYTVYSKESLRSYLKNPLSDSNQQNLRKVSQFLYYLSFQLRRIISYYASQVDLSVYNVIPNYSLTEKNDSKTMLKNYEQVLIWLEKMNMSQQIYNMLITAWREDCFYGYIYYDDSGESDQNSFVIIPMDGNYCKISSINLDGTLNYAFDFSFFTGSNKIFLDFWDKEFTKKYNTYLSDSKQRWQELDPERTICIKINADQTDRVIPPLASLYEDIIDLIDLRGISNVKDALSIYKLLVAKIDTLNGAKDPDDFAVDLNTAVDFYNKMASALPDEVGIVLSPMDITPVEFEKHASDDTNEISKAMSNLWESAGVTQILDSQRLTGATAVKMSTIADCLMATKPILPQIEARVNRFLNYVLPNNGMRVKYYDVTPYTKADKINEIKDAATLGEPVKMQYAALLGLTPKDMLSLCFLENDVLKLNDKLVPLASSFTQSAKSSSGGAPKKNDGELTDEGEKTKDQEKNKM